MRKNLKVRGESRASAGRGLRRKAEPAADLLARRPVPLETPLDQLLEAALVLEPPPTFRRRSLAVLPRRHRRLSSSWTIRSTFALMSANLKSIAVTSAREISSSFSIAAMLVVVEG